MSRKQALEDRFEKGLFASRWLMAPMYLGLVVALGMMTVIFLRELAYYAPQVLTLSPEKDDPRRPDADRPDAGREPAADRHVLGL